ncbi:MAG: hydantoinase B/oxoprolinase family protein [Gammaproteobacteria bacterium]|nr:hydantoinase B/oxoprolinase family protein [Gammaproteobacteria bacterium]
MQSVDKITASVIQRRLFFINEEMGEAMLRTASSQILNASRDFSTGMFDGAGRLISQAEHIPLHVGGLPFAMRSVLDWFTHRVDPGDVILLNDPYHGGNHLPDLTCFVPVFLPGASEPAFWTTTRAHQSDIGGSAAGSYNPAATEIWQEGIRITPIKLYERGVLCDDLLHLIATNVRHTEEFKSDLAAMVGSARTGARRLENLIGEYGFDLVVQAVDHILDSAEAQVRACIRQWRDGTYRGEAIMDDDGHGTRDIAIRARVTIRDDEMDVDLSDSAAQVKGIVNSSYANTISSVHMAIAYLVEPETPKNAGSFRPIRTVTKPGTVVHPHAPAPVTLSTNHPSQEIAEAIMQALAEACPDRVVSGWGKRFRVAITGENPRTGKPFIWHLFHARPGAGASHCGDGWSNIGELSSAGGLKFGSIEVMEARFPLFFERHEFRPDSGGDGRFRGGAGVSMAMRLETETPVVGVTAGEGRVHPPHGMFGGRSGQPHRYRLISRSGSERMLGTKEVGIDMRPGDRLVVESAGGGGFGDPSKRDPEARARDLADGLASA